MRKTVAIAGLGTIGSFIASKIDSLDGLRLIAVADRDVHQANIKKKLIGLDVPALSVDDLAEAADIVVEALPAIAAKALYEQVIAQGKILVALSSGIIVSNPSLVISAKKTGAKIIVPSGAIGGLDALKAAKEGNISSVSVITTKAPCGLAGAPYLKERGIDILSLVEPTLIFSGSAIEAAKAFPANVNVVAAVSLAGIGPEKTTIEVWADPFARQNSHRLRVESDSSNFEIKLVNFPSPTNPKTSHLASLSVIATLRDIGKNFLIGA